MNIELSRVNYFQLGKKRKNLSDSKVLSDSRLRVHDENYFWVRFLPKENNKNMIIKKFCYFSENSIFFKRKKSKLQGLGKNTYLKTGVIQKISFERKRVLKKKHFLEI